MTLHNNQSFRVKTAVRVFTAGLLLVCACGSKGAEDPVPNFRSIEHQRGERIGEHEGRLAFLERYQAFLSETQLPTEQERKVRRILGEAQLEYDEMVKERDEGGRSLGKRIAGFDASVASRLSEVLTDEQLRSFKKHMKTAWGFVAVHPFDLPIYQTKGMPPLEMWDEWYEREYGERAASPSREPQ